MSCSRILRGLGVTGGVSFIGGLFYGSYRFASSTSLWCETIAQEVLTQINANHSVTYPLKFIFDGNNYEITLNDTLSLPKIIPEVTAMINSTIESLSSKCFPVTLGVSTILAMLPAAVIAFCVYHCWQKSKTTSSYEEHKQYISHESTLSILTDEERRGLVTSLHVQEEEQFFSSRGNRSGSQFR